VALPANIQYVWPHPSRRTLYAVSSNGGPQVTGDTHRANALTIDPATGALQMHGAPAALPSRPIHCSVDASGQYLLTAYNNPSNITVHRLNGDGTIGTPVEQPAKLDAGIYAHQILATPSNDKVLLVTRGNDAKPDKPEDPGAIKTFGFNGGALTSLASIAPGTGLGFGPRHLDFHPTQPWVFVSIERQNQIYVYRMTPDGDLSPQPLFVKSTILGTDKHTTSAGPIHVHPNGRFVYLTNRAGVTPTAAQERFEGRPVFNSNDSSIAVYSINQQTGEPTLIETTYAEGAHTRTFSFDASGRILVAGSLAPIAVRQGDKVSVIPAALSVFRVGDNGKLTFVRKYDIDTGSNLTQWWSGMVQMA